EPLDAAWLQERVGARMRVVVEPDFATAAARWRAAWTAASPDVTAPARHDGHVLERAVLARRRALARELGQATRVELDDALAARATGARLPSAAPSLAPPGALQ